MSSHENLSPQVAARLIRELRTLFASPPSGIRVVPSDDDILTEIHAEIDGPEGTPFVGGVFHCKLVLGSDFPASPPKGYFLTRIFHPNIAENGEICVNTLKRDWSSDLGLGHVLQVIRCLLIVPFPESSLNDEAGRLFMESYDDYAQRARLMTSIHAAPASSNNTTRSTEADCPSDAAAKSTASIHSLSGSVHAAKRTKTVSRSSAAVETNGAAAAKLKTKPVDGAKKKKKTLKRL